MDAAVDRSDAGGQGFQRDAEGTTTDAGLDLVADASHDTPVDVGRPDASDGGRCPFEPPVSESECGGFSGYPAGLRCSWERADAAAFSCICENRGFNMYFWSCDRSDSGARD